MELREHPRTPVVEMADSEFNDFVLRLKQKHQLTLTEMLTIINNWENRQLRYALRSERHPDDPSKAADTE